MADEYEDNIGELDEAGAEIGEDEFNSEDDDDALEDSKGVSEEEVSDEEDEQTSNGTDCAYRNMRAKKTFKEDPIVIDELYDEQINKATMGGYQIIDDPELRVTAPILSKYEFARCWGLRTRHISKGAPSRVLVKGRKLTAMQSAALEIREGLSPLILLRPMPGYKEPTAEKWYFHELKVPQYIWPAQVLDLLRRYPQSAVSSAATPSAKSTSSSKPAKKVKS